MDLTTTLIFLSSGLFLGWSLGANDAANVFGTAVGSRMVRFTTAALICSVFVILGATISGAGAAHTLGELGGVNAIGGAFMAAFSAALTVMWMTKLGLPVSTSQAVVGGIIGWNLYSGSATDIDTLWKILGTWVAAPLLAGAFAALLYPLTKKFLAKAKLHILRQDAYTRWGLVLIGAFGAYALGANNIANVMGVFVPSSPFTDFNLGGYTMTSVQQLFLVGGIAIAVGVYTYSKNVMMTVGGGIVPLSPVASWVVVVAESLVLILFASVALEHLLASNGLPTIPLVPVSSSQAVVGAVIGIGLLQGARNINWSVLGNISLGWLATPLISAGVCFVALFFLQNVFNQEVFRAMRYSVTDAVVEKIAREGQDADAARKLVGQEFATEMKLMGALAKVAPDLSYTQRYRMAELAEVTPVRIDPVKLQVVQKGHALSESQYNALEQLAGQTFDYPWMLSEALAQHDPSWQFKEKNTLNKIYNIDLKGKLEYVLETFKL